MGNTLPTLNEELVQEVEGRRHHVTQEEDVFYDSLEDVFDHVPVGHRPKACGSRDEECVTAPPCEDNKVTPLPSEGNPVTSLPFQDDHFGTLPREDILSGPLAREDDLSRQLPCEDNLSRPLPRKDNLLRPSPVEDSSSRPLSREYDYSRSLSREDNYSKPSPREDNLSRSLPREDSLSRPLPHEDDYSRPLPHEDSLSRPLPHEDDNSRPLPREDSLSRPLPHEDDNSRPLPREDSLSRPLPHEDDNSRPLPREDSLSRPLPHEDDNSRPLPREDSLSRPLPHEDDNSRPLPREDSLSRPLPHEDDNSRPLPREDSLSRPLPHEDDNSRPLPREDSLSRPLPHEDDNSRPLPREDSLSRPLPHEDDNSRPLPREDSLSRPLPLEDDYSRPLPREDSLLRPLPHEDDYSRPLPCKDSLSRPLPHEDDNSRQLPREDSLSRPLPLEDDYSRPLPREDNLSRPLPSEDNHSRQLPREDNHSRPLLREDNHSRLLLREDNHSRPLTHEYNHSRPLPREDNLSRPLPNEDNLSRPLLREENHPKPLPHEDNHSKPLPHEDNHSGPLPREDNHSGLLPREDNHSRPLPREDSLSRPLPREDSHAAAPPLDANRVMVSLLEDKRVTASPRGGEHRDDPPREDEHQTSQKAGSFTTDPVKASIAMDWEEDMSDPFEKVLARRDCHTNHSTNQEKTSGEKIDALLQSLKKLQASGKQRSTGTPHHYSDEEGDHDTITQRSAAQHDSRPEQHYPEGHEDRRTPRHYPEEHQDHMTSHHYSDEEEEEDKRAQHYKDREHGSRSQHPDYSMQDRSNEQLHDSDSDEQDSRTYHQGDEQDKRRQHLHGEVRENDQHKRQQHYQDGSKELATTTLQHDEQNRIQQHYSDEDEGSKPQHQSPKDEANRTLHAGQERHSWGRGEARGCVRGGPHWMGQREDHTHSWRQERPAKVQNEHGLAWKHNHSWRTAENDHPESNWRQQHTHPGTYYRGRDHHLDGDASHNMYDEGDTLEPEDLVSVLVERPHFRCTFINLFDYHCFATESVRQVAAAHPDIFNMTREGVQLKPQIKLCRANQTQRCNSGRSCPDLHVCSTYISSWCSETPCRPGHSLYTDHNKAVLKTFMLEHLSVTHIKRLLKHLIPTAAPPSGCLEVCQDYNSGQCKKTDCQALHLCRRFVVTRANCDRPGCVLNHNPHDPACSMLLVSHRISINENIKDIIVAVLNANPSLVPKDSTKPLPPRQPQSQPQPQTQPQPQSQPQPQPQPQPQKQSQPQPHTKPAPKDTSPKQKATLLDKVKQWLEVDGGTSKNKESTAPHAQEDTVTPAQGTTAKNTSDKKSERVKESGQDSNSKAAHKSDRKHPSDSNTATGGVGGRQTMWVYHRTGSVDIAEICRFSVEGICMYEDQGCRRLHASQPFHWQVLKSAGQDSWFNLPAALVTCLEMAFCDPSKNGVKLPSLDPAQKRRLQDVLDQDTWYANFEAMVLTNSDYSKVVGLRRLCVQAGATPHHTKARTFNWFFCDVRGLWVKYGQVDSTGQANLKSSITSSDIEAHYLARPEQPLSFRNSQFSYLINFGAMTQTNQTTKAQRAVRRRPELHPSLSAAK